MLHCAFASLHVCISSLRRSFPALLLTGLATNLTVGCGSGSTGVGSPVAPVTTLVITQQPADETVPLGSAGTFTVSAVGTGNLSYQWSRNGTAVSGGTGTTLATDAVSLSNSGDLYSVTVRDANGSVASTSAKLTVGPRSPLARDLRFQQVGSAATAASVGGRGRTGNTGVYGGIINDSFIQYIGSPLELGPAYYTCVPSAGTDCSWGFFVTALPTSNQALGILYTAGTLQSLTSDLQILNSRNNLISLPEADYVVTSLAMPPGINAYGVAATYGNQGSGFDLKQETVSAAALQATVAADALQSRVVTAVAFDVSGNALLLSYGWQADKSTVYDTTAVLVAAGDVAASATNLAAQGYILSAFGGDEVHGYVLVGTKVKGDTLPRPLIAATLAQGKQTTTVPSTAGYAPVGFVQYSGPADASGAASYTTVLYQR